MTYRSPEHELQIQVLKWVRECVACEHLFMAFDRAKSHSEWQHAREATRGIRTGQTDTCLLWRDIGPAYSLWIELKTKSNPDPTDAQIRFGEHVVRAGGQHGTARSVVEYYRICHHFGVPLRPLAALRAEHYDLLLLAADMKAKGTVPKSYKPRIARPTQGALNALARARKRGVMV